MSDNFLSRIRELKFKQLLVFERAVALGSTYKAAEALHMSQPNVFKIICQLESLLDVPLFERHSRGMTPTVYAERLLVRVRPMLGDARAMGEELVSLHAGEIGHVAVGTLISASARLLPESILLLKQRAPGVQITVREATNNLLFPMLEGGELDLVVGRLPDVRGEGVRYCALYDERLVVVTRAAHPLVKSMSRLVAKSTPRQKPFSLTTLSDYPWILPLPESPVRKQVVDFFSRNRIPLPENQIQSFSMLTNFSLLQNSDTVAMLPLAAVKPLIESAVLCALPINEQIMFGTIGYSVRADRKPTPAGAAFIEALEMVGRGIAAAI